MNRCWRVIGSHDESGILTPPVYTAQSTHDVETPQPTEVRVFNSDQESQLMEDEDEQGKEEVDDLLTLKLQSVASSGD